LAAERNVLAAIGELDGIAGKQADCRRQRPSGSDEFDGARPEPGADRHDRGVEDLAVVETAIAALTGGPVERILVNGARQFPGEIPGADAVAERVVAQNREMVGEALVERNQSAVVLCVATVVALLDVAII